MKALPSIAFSGFRGTASEVTARQVRGRTVLSGRAQHSRVKTPGQSFRRASFSFISKQYRTLTDSQRRAWDTLAASHRKKSLTGDGTPLTGHNLFVCLNSNRALLGVPLTRDAPDTVHGSHYVAFDDIWITPGRLLIAGLKDPDSPESRLVVKMAATDSAAVTKAWGRTVITGTFSTSYWGDIDLTEIYTEQFDIPVIAGHKYFIEMYWIDALSGYVSETTLVCYPVVSAAGTLNGHGNVASSYAYFSPDTSIPYEGNMQSAYILARGTDNRVPQLFVMNIVRRSSDSYIQFAHRGGFYSKPSDIVGGGLLM